MLQRIEPRWPAPTWVRALTTCRNNLGFSQAPFHAFNLSTTVEDNISQVELNRQILQQQLNLAYKPVWLQQIHSPTVINVDSQTPLGAEADGSWTQQKGLPCVVTTADCLPLLLCDAQGTLVSAVHGGWKGILRGIIPNAIAAIRPHAQGEILAWMGPAMGPQRFEVGSEVRDQFIALDPHMARAFKPYDKGKWLADIYEMARIQLRQAGITGIWGGEFCTYEDPSRFYSYRRDKVTGRMATLIWLDPL